MNNVISLDAYRRKQRAASRPNWQTMSEEEMDAYTEGIVGQLREDMEFWESTACHPLLPYRNALTYILKRWVNATDGAIESYILLLIRLLQTICVKRQKVNFISFDTLDDFGYSTVIMSRSIPRYSEALSQGRFLNDMDLLESAGLIHVEESDGGQYRVTVVSGRVMRLAPPAPTMRVRRTRTKK